MLPWSSEVTYASTTFLCIGRLVERLERPFFWIDVFACPPLFSWHTGKSVSRDVIPKSSEFSAEHYATLVAYPALFYKYLKPFLCLVGLSRNYTLDENTYPQFLRDDDEEIDLLSFIRTVDPTKVRIGERLRDEDEPNLLETTIGGSGEQAKQGDSASGGHGVGIQLVVVVMETVVEDVSPMQLKRQKKQKNKVVDVGEPSHLAKKLRDDHRALGGPTIGGKSQSSIQRLFAGAVKNAEVRGGVMPTLPFVTSFVSTTPEREGEDYIELLAGANLRTIGTPQRFVISLDSSDHSCVNIANAEVDFVVRTSVPIITSATTTTPAADLAAIAKEKLVGSSVFGVDSPSTGESHPIPGGSSDCTGSDFLIGGIRTDDGGVYREMVDEFAPSPKFFASVRGREHEQLFTEFNVGAARQMPLSAEVRMHAEYNIRERRRLNSIVEEKDALMKAKDKEIRSLKAQLVLKKAEAAERKVLDVKVADLAASVKFREQEVADLDDVVTPVKLQNDNLVDKDDWMREMNDKFDKFNTNLVEMALNLEERFYPHLLTTIYGLRWLLTHRLKLAIARCLNSTEYLSTFGVAIGKAVEKGMQDELSTGITHGAEGRVLTDVVTYNPSVEAKYLSALQHLQSVNFSLIPELKSNKYASIDTIMNLLRLEDSLAEKLGLTESQPNVNQLMVPIHHSLDQRVVGAFALSLSLDVSSSRV
nr:hypothetical protein [Tanacetum cinerariifolium]